MEENQRLEDWLSQVCESPKTRDGYLLGWKHFATFCKGRGKDPFALVDDYRAVKYEGERAREIFLEEWQDLLRAFNTWLKPKFAPLTAKNHLSVVKSFLRYWKIPLDVDLPRHACVLYHNRDLKREELKQILTFASARDRVMWLVMAESGMRTDNAVHTKYWQIKEDFEAKRVPMRIMLPSSTLKDHVGDRWTFIGEDGFRELQSYLERRLPLKDDDFVFASEKAGLVKGEQFSDASLSMKFNNLVQKLKIDKSLGIAGKPKEIRLHGLRKFFFNNMKAAKEYRDFWMGHSLGVDAHYISRDVEEHRRLYAEGYKFLRVLNEAGPETVFALYQQIRERDTEIEAMKKQMIEVLEMKDRLAEVENQLYQDRRLFETELGITGQEEKRVKREIRKGKTQA